MKLEIVISSRNDAEILRRLAAIQKQLGAIMAKQSEQAAALRAAAEQQRKGLAEIRGKFDELNASITHLQEVIANGTDQATEELVTAVNEVVAGAKAVDDVIPDATEPPAEPA